MSIVVVDDRICPICGKVLPGKSHVINHIKTHRRNGIDRIAFNIWKKMERGKLYSTWDIIQMIRKMKIFLNHLTPQQRYALAMSKMKQLFHRGLVEQKKFDGFIFWVKE